MGYAAKPTAPEQGEQPSWGAHRQFRELPDMSLPAQPRTGRGEPHPIQQPGVFQRAQVIFAKITAAWRHGSGWGTQAETSL